MSRTPEYDDAYPPELWQFEQRFLPPRDGQAAGGDRPPEDVLGVALSGGGIRSATFCLGIFQALAQLDLLRRIDYLSTVSGGGYFGGFFGRLFRRRLAGADGVRRPIDRETVRRILDPDTGKNEMPSE